MALRRQLLLSDDCRVKMEQGGSLSSGKRKAARPIATKRAMHVVLRSSKAVGLFSLHFKARPIQLLVQKLAKQFGVKVYRYSNNGNHLHLLVLATHREGFKKFLMALSGRIAQLVTGAKKGAKLASRFFDFIPYTRIVEWGKAYEAANKYVELNLMEALGIVPYRVRQRGSDRLKIVPKAAATLSLPSVVGDPKYGIRNF